MSAPGRRAWAIVPARSGSKGLPDKNIRLLAGTPLFSHAVRFALAANLFERVLLSTDSAEYAELGRAHGAWVPFLRSADAARDDSMEEHVLADLDKQLTQNGITPPDIVVWLRPTFPFRAQDDLAAAMALLTDTVDAVRLVTEGEPRLYAVENGYLTPMFDDGGRSMVRRQEFPVTYKVFHTDIFWYRNISYERRFLGNRIKAVAIHKICGTDIDGIEDIEIVDAIINAKSSFISRYVN